jgi:hypothetical protein
MTRDKESGSFEPCLSCGGSDLRDVPGSETLSGVTSDCRPWPEGATLCFCFLCGLLQKRANAAWRRDVESIYRDYTLYDQAAGKEQFVFGGDSGIGNQRSVQLLSLLKSHFPLPSHGRWLDVGSGNGPWLRACSEGLPAWTFVGQDLTDKYRALIEAIPNVEGHFKCSLREVPGEFDVVSLIHVLEHMLSPLDELSTLRLKLGPLGLLFVQVPDYRENPFDLLIVDHAAHFSRKSLTRLLCQSGFNPTGSSGHWIPKEFSVVSHISDVISPVAEPLAAEIRSLWESANRSVQWLRRVVDGMGELASTGKVGLFGTSIAGTWLCRILGDQVAFFVDEDPNRVGRAHMGRPILHPDQLNRKFPILVALSPAAAIPVVERLSSRGLVSHSPPPLPV